MIKKHTKNINWVGVICLSLLSAFLFSGFVKAIEPEESCPALYEQSTDIIRQYDSNHDKKISLQEAYNAVSAWMEYSWSDASLLDLLKFCRQDCIIPVADNDPVSGTLSVSSTQVNVGENITLTVTGLDDDGLTKIWAYYQGKWHSDSADGTSFTSTFTFSESEPGTYTYRGYVYGLTPEELKETTWTEPKIVKVTVIAPEEETVDCDQEYGQEYWCSNYQGWQTECDGRGEAIHLPTGKVCQAGDQTYHYCVTCLEEECQYLYWFDSSTACGYKQFCGAYMYQGLRTFNTSQECEDAFSQITQNDPVSGTLSVSSTQVNVGEDIILTLTGQDDDGLKSLWAYYQGKWHKDSADGTSFTSTFNISESEPGSYVYLGYIYGTKPNGSVEYAWTEPRSVIVQVVEEEVEKPDLIISSIVSQPSSPTTNDEISFNVTIKNNGSEKMPYVSGGIITKISSESLPSGGWRICDAMITRLGAGETAIVDCPIVQTLSSGSHMFTFFVDSSNRLSESNENNNEKSAYLTVGGLVQNDPISGTFSVSATNVKVREHIVLTINAQDDQGVSKIMFYYKGAWHSQSCNGVTSCTKTYDLYESKPGTYYYYGYVYGTKLDGGMEYVWTNPKSVTVTVVQEQACSDSDQGDLYTKGYCEDSRHVNDGWDMCSDAVYQGGIIEYGCVDSSSGKVCGTKHHSCPNGCENGACIEEEVICTDSDGGKNYYVRGTTTGLYRDEKVTGSIWGENANDCSMREDQSLNYSIHYDCCSSPGSNQLNEAYCDANGIMQSVGYQCPKGCQNGACIE